MERQRTESLKKLDLIKAFAFDLDDTLLDGEGKLTDYSRQALIDAARAGYEPIIASGRSFYSLPDYLLDIPGVRYAICSNGANLFDIEEKKCINSLTLNPKSVKQLLTLANDFRDEIYLDAFKEGRPHSDRRLLDTLLANDKISEHRKVYLRKTRIPEDDIFSFIEGNIDGLDCINYNAFDRELFYKLYERVGREIEGVYVTSSLETLIEISDKDCGKGRGLERLCRYIGILPENVMSFGNADNDADMLIRSGLGVAVSNSSQYAKDSADYVIGSHKEDAVAKEIYKIINP